MGGGSIFDIPTVGTDDGAAQELEQLRADMRAVRNATNAELVSIRNAMIELQERQAKMNDVVEVLLKIAENNPDAAREMAVLALEKLHGR